jgi:hypothetical protein
MIRQRGAKYIVSEYDFHLDYLFISVQNCHVQYCVMYFYVIKLLHVNQQ